MCGSVCVGVVHAALVVWDCACDLGRVYGWCIQLWSCGVMLWLCGVVNVT
jgi:hypothetical protein